MARPGRKRKPKAKRRQTTAIGQGRLKDHGTMETQLRSAETVGAEVVAITEEGQSGRVMTDGDPTLSDCWISILYARGEIAKDQYEAAFLFKQRAMRACRPFDARAFDPSRPTIPSHEDLSDDALKAAVKAERRHRDDVRLLLSLSRATHDAVVNLCLYDRRPSWFNAKGAAKAKRKESLMIGLDRLAEVFHLSKKAA